jgi:hypothetical protein
MAFKTSGSNEVTLIPAVAIIAFVETTSGLMCTHLVPVGISPEVLPCPVRTTFYASLWWFRGLSLRSISPEAPQNVILVPRELFLGSLFSLTQFLSLWTRYIQA